MNDDVLAGEYSPANTAVNRREENMLKKEYEAPALMVETYMLDTSIAANCLIRLEHTDMDCYDKYFNDGETFALVNAQNSFTKDACDCYYSAGGEGFFTS